MGVHILEDTESSQAVLYCSVTDWAFGPLFPTREAAEKFLEVCPKDPRSLTDAEMGSRFAEFCTAYVCECGSVRDETDMELRAEDEFGECTCENNGDYCPRCNAIEDLKEWEPEPGERFECFYCLRKKREEASHVRTARS